MLITPREVIEIAYITQVDDTMIKDHIIDVAEQAFIKPVLNDLLYQEVVNKPGNYVTLIDDFIKPCLAFYVKYLTYLQQLFENAEYSSPDPTKANKLISPEIAALLHYKVNQSILHDILFIARLKQNILIDHLNNVDYPFFIKPTIKRVSGIFISN